MAIDNDAKRAALRRISKDLEAFVGTYCGNSSTPPNDFVDEKCQDAALMLQEAVQALARKG